MEYTQYLEEAISMARAAGNVQLDYFRSGRLDTHTKLNDSDVVTAADKASEKLIISTIRRNILTTESLPKNPARTLPTKNGDG